MKISINLKEFKPKRRSKTVESKYLEAFDQALVVDT